MTASSSGRPASEAEGFWIGPQRVDGKPSLRWTSSPDRKHRRWAEISACTPRGAAEYATEVVGNDDRRQTVEGAVGVLEELYFDNPRLPSGHYLLVKCACEGLKEGGRDPVALVLAVLYLGPDPDLVVTYTSQQRANDFGIVGQTIVWDPTPVVTNDKSAPVSDGSTLFREFNPTGGIGPPPPPGLRYFMRGYLAPKSPSVIDTSVSHPDAGALPRARSLLEVGNEPGQVVIKIFCEDSRDRGHASARPLATVTDTKRYGLVFRRAP